MQATPIVKDLVLVGAGHSHAIALKLLGMNPIPGVRITLITETTYTPYSGMLPGHVAGYYSIDDCHIDMRPLSRFANTRLYIDRVIGLDLQSQQVICANRPPVPYDVLSINIGSTPAKATVPGADRHAIPAKPIRTFLKRWQTLLKDIRNTPQKPWQLAIVGGGVGGVELSLNMSAHIKGILSDAGVSQSQFQIHLFQRGHKLVPDLNDAARSLLSQSLARAGVKVHMSDPVTQIEDRHLTSQSGIELDCDRIFWVTQASAQPWLAASGLATDSNGFIALKDTLESQSHRNVFSAGDIASVTQYPRPKAGVFAVRQGKPLYENLRRALLEQPLKPFKPQKAFLRIVGTGDRAAVAAKWNWAWHSPWMWRWKEWIEFRFMDRFRILPEMSAMSAGQGGKTSGLTGGERLEEMAYSVKRCGGCGSKVGSTVLSRVLQRLQEDRPFLAKLNPEIPVGLASPDDAAVLRLPGDRNLVQTLDYFTSPIDDPYVFGQIVTHHCLSDLFAMGADPHSVLALATLPYAVEAKLEDTLFQLMSGAITVLEQAGAQLIGGHTVEGAQLGFGLSCNGLGSSKTLLRKGGLKPGQKLILTKGLGTGAILAAQMQAKAQGRWMEAAIASMLQSNQEAAACLRRYGCGVCTDVTGFGLVGHLLEMIKSSQSEPSALRVQLDWQAVPTIQGAKEAIKAGFTSSIQPQNIRLAKAIANPPERASQPDYAVLFDPQTSGGLLGAVDAQVAEDCLTELRAIGYADSTVIGEVEMIAAEESPIVLV